MSDKKMSIEQFHRLLHSESEGGSLLAALRKLTELKNTEKLTETPQPLGTWSGWSW
jgi:hypothetical protein